MSNLKTLLLILSLLLVPVALSEPEAIQNLLRRLDSKRVPASVQEAAAKALLKRLLPTHDVSFVFRILPKVLSFFLLIYYLYVNFGVCFFLNAASFHLGVPQFSQSHHYLFVSFRISFTV